MMRSRLVHATSQHVRRRATWAGNGKQFSRNERNVFRWHSVETLIPGLKCCHLSNFSVSFGNSKTNLTHGSYVTQKLDLKTVLRGIRSFQIFGFPCIKSRYPFFYIGLIRLSRQYSSGQLKQAFNSYRLYVLLWSLPKPGPKELHLFLKTCLLKRILVQINVLCRCSL